MKEKWLKVTGFAHSQTTNKLVNKAANDSARVSGQDRKKLPALGTNQIAGFGGFHPLATLEKNNKLYLSIFKKYIQWIYIIKVTIVIKKVSKNMQIIKGVLQLLL